ncbi:uncharacterized protein HGUI_00792 [Hanseniaspora guilliermondii]|uniref:Mitochondrial intermembrane space import and assembly protein 40 n=1 Tax=Hanseniaspora guilliermondii TaxID=56406 RepID=A0A1L0AWV8_9ASCO|nr:uncharacterized protein HGUI_00792 [Hanseniaspora guilliermondii]
MLRKQLIQSLNRKSFSSISKQNAVKASSLSLKMKALHPMLTSKARYSSHNDDGAKFDDKFMNVSIEDVFAYGISFATIYYILDSTLFYKKEEKPVEVKEAEPIKEEVEETTPVVEEEKTSAETSDVEEIAIKNNEEDAVNDTLAVEEDNAVEDTKVLEEENLVNEQSSQEEAESTDNQEQPIVEEETPSTEETASDEKPQAEETGEEAVDPSAGPAYNPETGEINWDCPCLGGMAHGPCGEEFKSAFSCFIYSEAEPKGVDCVEKFQGMQECFKKHPEIYAEQLRDADEAEHEHIQEQASENAVSEPETVVEEVLVGDVPAAVIEEVVPIVNEKVEEITPIIEEKVEEIVAKAENSDIIPESVENLVEEGLPVNADD